MKNIGFTSMVVIIVTLILFLLALFTKGFTHDLLLEAGVFLVSVKLVIMGYKNNIESNKILNEIQKIKELLERKSK